MKKTVGKQHPKTQTQFLHATKRHHLLTGTFPTSSYVATNIESPLTQATTDISQLQGSISNLQNQLNELKSVFTYENQTRTINIPNTYTAAQINAEIAQIGKFHTEEAIITIQFEDSPTKNIDPDFAFEKPLGYTTIRITNHGLSAGDVISIEGTNNYDGNYIIYYVYNPIEITIEHPYIPETFTGAEVVRIAQKMEEPLNFSGFSGMTLYVTGSPADPYSLNSQQKVFLDFSGVSDHAFFLKSNLIVFWLEKLKIKFNSTGGYSGIFTNEAKKTLYVRGCYILGNGINKGACIEYKNSFGMANSNYVSNAKNGIYANKSISVNSKNNESHDTLPQYGLFAAGSSFVFKSGTQPTGSIADELTADGAEIR